jgi:hypothetical protein
LHDLLKDNNNDYNKTIEIVKEKTNDNTLDEATSAAII